MARRRLLRPDRWPVLLNLPTDEDSLIRNYTMSGDDLDRALRKRGHHNQLGFAVQLCLMRHTGCQLAQNDAAPAEVVSFIAGQLDVSSAVLADYGRRVPGDNYPERSLTPIVALQLREQMTRLFRATISFEQSSTRPDGQGVRWMDMQIAPEGELWWETRTPEQSVLWGSWIELGEKFYEAIIAAPVPLDMRALKALKQSPLALDIYAVMNYRAHTAKEAVFLSWDLLRKQLGTDFTDNKLFKRKLLAVLRKVRAVAPHLKIEQVRGGVVLHPSRGAITGKHPSHPQ